VQLEVAVLLNERTADDLKRAARLEVARLAVLDVDDVLF